MKLHVTTTAIAASLLLGLGTARAQGSDPFETSAPEVDEKALAEVVDLNKKAIGLYRDGQHQAAMNTLTTAAQLAHTSGLGQHDVMARTQIHLGIVAINGLKERHRGLAHLGRAVAIRPRIKLTAALATPALKRDLKTAAKKWIPTPAEVAAGPLPALPGAPPPPAAPAAAAAKPKETEVATGKVDPEKEPPLPRNVPQPLYCPTPDQGPPGRPVPLFCLTQPDLAPSKVVAFFRPAGGENYTSVTMNRNPSGWLSATVPARAVRGGSLQVYFEAKDSGGNVAAAAGKDELPSVILLKQGAPEITPKSLALIEVGPPPSAAEEDSASDEATPLQLRELAAKKAEEEAPVPKGRPRRREGSIFVGLGAGTGYGWHGEMQLERHTSRQVGQGFSPAGVGYLAPEVGYQVGPRFSLSLQSRHQYLPASGSGDAEVTSAPPQLAHAILLRLQYALFDLGDLQFTTSFAAGGGSALRMQVPPNKRAGIAASDTIVAGPGALGPGLGLAYNFSDHFILAIEARALAGVPKFAVLLEGAANIQVAF